MRRLSEERLRKGQRPMLLTRHTFFSVVTPTRSSVAACCAGQGGAGNASRGRGRRVVQVDRQAQAAWYATGEEQWVGG